MTTNKPKDDNLGCWNAYVESGETSEIRKERLASAPSHLQDHIKRHAQLVYKLKRLNR
jgi:hypothetical protein